MGSLDYSSKTQAQAHYKDKVIIQVSIAGFDTQTTTQSLHLSLEKPPQEPTLSPTIGQPLPLGRRPCQRLPPRRLSTWRLTAKCPVDLFGFVREERGSFGMVQSPAWELDDWEFTGGMEEEVVVSDPPPRLGFGPVLTLQEAEEATPDLKEAIEK